MRASSKHVLWLTPAYPHRLNGIAGIFHKTQAEALVRAGIDVTVVAPVPWVPTGFRGPFPSRWRRFSQYPYREHAHGVTVVRPRYLAFPGQNYYGSPHLFIERSVIKLSIPKPDLIHAHFAYPSGLAALSIAKKWRVPTVLTLHGGDVNVFPHRNQLARKRFLQAVHGSTEVVAVSHALANAGEEISGRPSLVHRVGIRTSAFTRTTPMQTARQALALPPDAFIVLYVGSIIRQKGIPELLEALRELAPSGVVGAFVGKGDLQDTVASAPYSYFLGSLPNSHVPLAMSAANLLVLPSHSEGLPTILVEAGAMELPIVATSVGGIPELLGDDRGTLIPPRSSTHIQKAIQSIRIDERSGRARAARLKEHILKHYDADNNARDLVALYSSLVGSPWESR